MPSNSTPKDIPKSSENSIQTNTQMFIGTLAITAKRWKQPKCPSTDECINKMWSKPYNRILFIVTKKGVLGFPGGAVVESLPADAGDTGSGPGLGGSHVPRSGWACEPQLLSLRVWGLCSVTREAMILRGPRTVMKSGPRLPQLEKALAQKQRPNTAINK